MIGEKVIGLIPVQLLGVDPKKTLFLWRFKKYRWSELKDPTRGGCSELTPIRDKASLSATGEIKVSPVSSKLIKPRSKR